MPTRIAAGNWKMNGLAADAAVAREIGAARAACDVVLFPPATLLTRLAGAGVALGDERLRLAAAQPIVDGILDDGPDALVNARPLIESVVVSALNTPPAKAAVREAVRTVDAKLFEGNPDTLLLNLTDAAVVAAQALDAVSPKNSNRIKEIRDSPAKFTVF